MGERVFEGSEVNFTNMCGQISRDEHSRNFVSVTERQILTHWPVQYIKEEPSPLRDVVSTADIVSFFSLFFPRFVQ